MDVDTCFRRLRMGQSLAECFFMELVRARGVSLNGCEVSGQMVGHDEWLYPCAGALPMGFSWSLYFAQAVNEHSLHEVEGIQDVSVMNDRTHPCVLVTSNPGRVVGYVHVDNLGLLSLWISAVHRRWSFKSLQNEFDAVVSRSRFRRSSFASCCLWY